MLRKLKTSTHTHLTKIFITLNRALNVWHAQKKADLHLISQCSRNVSESLQGCAKHNGVLVGKRNFPTTWNPRNWKNWKNWKN
uniref:Uncharacterized protein n=1 Tax=Chionoecetes opilio bacilliform virus TaxID=1825681 RepID=A0A1Q3DLI8_9VIRU|nr:hypothetical protein SCV_072 [Chionoecetes opilio bacilliform virus]